VVASRATDRFSFGHALIRETLVEEVRTVNRLDLHRRIGEAIESVHAADLDPYLSELAYHFVEAAPRAGAAKALDYCEQAAGKALRQLAFEDAIAQVERALAILQDDDAEHAARRTDLLIALGDALRLSGQIAQATATYESAIDCARACGSSERLARAAVALSVTGFAATWFAAAGKLDDKRVKVLEESRVGLGAVETPLRVHVLTRLAIELMWTNAFEQRERLTREAVEIARRIGDPAVLAKALTGRAWAIMGPDTLDERHAIEREAHELAEHAAAADTLLNLAVLRVIGAQESASREELEQAAAAIYAAAEAVPILELRWYAAVSKAMAPFVAGRLDEAEELVRQAYDLGRAAGDQRNVLQIFAGQIGVIRFLQGRMGEVEAGAKSFIEEYPGLPIWNSVIAICHIDAGREAEARRVFDRLAAERFASLPRDTVWLANMGILCFVCTCLHDVDRARVLYDQLSPFASRNCSITIAQGMLGAVPFYLGMLATMLHRFDEAIEHCEEAARRDEEMGNVPWIVAGRTIGAIARLLRANPGDRERAIADLEDGRATADRLGFKRHVDRPLYLRTIAAIARELSCLDRVADGLGRGVSAEVLAAAGMRSREAAPAPQAPRQSFAARATAAAREQALRLAAKLVRGRSDETLEKRFGSAAVQMALFNAMAFSFQPDKAFGFEGAIAYELVYPERDGTRRASDFWSLTVEGGKARARRGIVANPALRIRISIADLTRLVTGELNPVTALLKGLTSVEGDMVVAARLVEMFGGIAATGMPSPPSEPQRSPEAATADSLDQVLVEARELLHGGGDDRATALELLNQVIDGAREIGNRDIAERAIAMKLEIQGVEGRRAEVQSSIDAVAASVDRRRPDLRAKAAPDGTVTVMFSDVEGFTEMTDRLGDVAAREVMRDHNRIVRAEVARHQGYEVELLGDGFLIVFSSARRGLECAIAIERALEERNRNGGKQPIRVRIGLHTGEVLRDQDKFFGKTVILASRIAGQARGGEIVVSAMIRELLASAPEFAFGEPIEVALKGISGLQRIHPVAW